jgi:hypothetical protein
MNNTLLEFVAEQSVSIGWGTYIVQALYKKQSFIAYHKAPEGGKPINGDDVNVSTVFWDTKQLALEAAIKMAIKA